MLRGVEHVTSVFDLLHIPSLDRERFGGVSGCRERSHVENQRFRSFYFMSSLSPASLLTTRSPSAAGKLESAKPGSRLYPPSSEGGPVEAGRVVKLNSLNRAHETSHRWDQCLFQYPLVDEEVSV